jgi:3-hydroxyisobutyrate dehydrogenase-like beta-hydroxyacid dehydrogenase
MSGANVMSDISVLGLGLMGSALAGAFLKGGRRVCVWNRSPGRTEPLVRLGAAAADGLAAAVAASPVVLICIDSYASTRALFEGPAMAQHLLGKAIVQLSTGTPRQARDAEAWFMARGARYLDGAILGGPAAMGTPHARILYAGQRESFDRHRVLLASLGGECRYVGEQAGAAAAIDFAWLSKLFGAFAGAAHGALICEAEGVDLEHYSMTFPEIDSARWMIDAIRKDAFANPSATLTVWNAALTHIREQARDSGIDDRFPDFVAGILDRAEAAGYGQEHIAAMVKVLRRVKA